MPGGTGPVYSSTVHNISTTLITVGGGAYWAGWAIARPLFGPNGQAMLIALPLFAAPK